MAISVTHATTATGADDPTKEINKAEWNAAHALAGLGTGVETALGVNVGSAGAVVVNGGALGTPSAGTLTNATGLPIGGISATGTPSAANFLRGDGSWAAASGGATLDGITAATADQAGISNADFSVRWNWAKTSNTENGLMLSESAASTNGTSTSGVPNQVLLRLATVAASTMSALRVDVRGNFLMAASPSTTQMLFADGTTSAPSIAAAGSTGTGIWWTSGTPLLNFSVSGTNVLAMFSSYVQVLANANLYVSNGTSTSLGIYNSSGNAGFFFASNVVAVATASGVENARFAAGEYQASKSTADAVSYAMNFRKSRGTVASPTAITTGDDLATISGVAYVGATGAYVTAATLTIDSDGTIANDSTGVGGIFDFATRKVGGSVTKRMTIDNNETAAETSILVSINGGAPVRVSKGANDSGGAGFAVLRIPN